jgi:hypothetical protein
MIEAKCRQFNVFDATIIPYFWRVHSNPAAKWRLLAPKTGMFCAGVNSPYSALSVHTPMMNGIHDRQVESQLGS